MVTYLKSMQWLFPGSLLKLCRVSHSPLSSCSGLSGFPFPLYLKSGHSPFLIFPRNTGWCLWIPHIYLSHSVPIPGPSFVYTSCLSWNIFLLQPAFSALWTPFQPVSMHTVFSPHGTCYNLQLFMC